MVRPTVGSEAGRRSSAVEGHRGKAEPGAKAWALLWMSRQVRTGVWRAGDRLPAERPLARACGVSRQTLRAALSQLERAGLLIRTEDGKGRRWSSTAPSKS